MATRAERARRVRITVLGSGSSGNATLVEVAGARVLIDAGFSGRDLERRLRAVDVDADGIAAIIVTHDHGDHTRGAGVLARRFGIPLYITDVTRRACAKLFTGAETVRSYEALRPFRIGALQVEPFLTAHDAVDPVAVTLRDVDAGHKLGIATDLGRPTAAVRHALAACHFLVLEANHDDAMLRSGPYPWSVKQRIASSHGHLSNRAAAELARELHHPELAGVVLAHLSEHCNDGLLARDTVGSTLERAGYRGPIAVAAQDEPLEPLEVAVLRRQAAPEQLTLF